MMRRLRPLRDERGFTLIETLASILIFGIMTIGLVPLLLSSIRGTALARSHTVGKEVAREAMERLRGLPFYVSYGTQAQKVDLLDLYLPCADPSMTASGCAGGGTRSYDATTGVFRLVCAATTDDPACAVRIPTGYEIEFETRFVEGNGETSVLPSSDYVWNVEAKDVPRTDLLHMSVKATWTLQGQSRSMTIQSLVGDRKSGIVKVAGSGRIDYAVQVLARYKDSSEISDLSALIGSGESSIESRLVSTADQRVRTAEIKLIAQTEPLATDLDTRIGALGSWHAPVAFAATAGLPSTPAQSVMNHPSIGQEVAFLDATQVDSVEVRADAEQPIAKGAFSLPSSSGTLGYVWVQGQKPQGGLTSSNNPLRLDYNRRMFSLAAGDSGPEQLSGSTEAFTGELGTASRRVETKAEVKIEEIRLFPVEYIGDGASFRRSIMQIQDFTASVSCNANGTTATPTATWSATIRYWTDGSGFQTVSVSGANGGSDLRTVLGTNPLLVPGEGILFLQTPDLYLFDEPSQDREGYFRDFTFAAPGSSTEGGTLAAAAVNEAINITTVPTNPNFAESGLSISIGKLSCSALDGR